MIVTFYSYKGGVGRSMALANIADLLARCGLRVLIVDFDLEAPGLEHFFPISHEEIRGHKGLLDLLLTYKYSMSTAAAEMVERDAFRQLEQFVAPVYPNRPEGGGIDILPAGRRLTEEQIGQYGEELRRFDWSDFYFSWSGELFFEWLRKDLGERYDIILIDSRTGVTEMGGICAYQLADVIVVLCAPNVQNIEGTDAMVRHFLSSQVRSVRGSRGLDLLVVPARVDQNDAALRGAFQRRFQERFARYEPSSLRGHGLTFWDLQIPYDSRYAFDEKVVTDPARLEDRKSLAAAYGKLLDGIALLGPDAGALAVLRSGSGSASFPAEPVLTQYDPTTRFASADVFISFGSGSDERAVEIFERLVREGFQVARPLDQRDGHQAGIGPYSDSIRSAKAALVLVGPEDDQSWWRIREVSEFFTARNRGAVMPVLLPGSNPGEIPQDLTNQAYIDLRRWDNAGWTTLLRGLRNATAEPNATAVTPDDVVRCPYLGMTPFSESDAVVFFGRQQQVAIIVDRIRHSGFCCIIGPAGVGKTSIIFAGVVPALRQGDIAGSSSWPLVVIRPGDRDVSITGRLANLVGVDVALEGASDGVSTLLDLLRNRFGRVLLVVDQLEEIFTQSWIDYRRDFIRHLVELCTLGRDVIVPLIALRSDFLYEALGVPDLADLLANPYLLGPLSGDDLRLAIEYPARLTGLALEPGLVEVILGDFGKSPGVMPLLQFVLLQLWRHRNGGYLTHAAYREIGAAHALGYYAETAYTGLAAADQDIARDVFLRLVQPGEGTADLRSRVQMRELVGSEAHETSGQSDVRRVIQILTGERILVTGIDAEGNTTVEIAHEIIIQGWPRLRRWIEENRAGLLSIKRLALAADEWDRMGRVSAMLMLPKHLDMLLMTIRPASMTATESQFVEASREYARTRQRWLAVRVAVATAISTLVGIVLVVGGLAISKLPAFLLVAGIVASMSVVVFIVVRRWSGRVG